MNCHAEDLGIRITAARPDPAPIDALRDMLAATFAADIAAVTAIVCEVMRDELVDLATHSDRAAAESGAAVLERNSGALQVEVARAFRILFDAKLVSRPASRAGLALIAEGKLEYELALDTCTARLEEQAGGEMSQLTARVAAMLGRPRLGEADNPVAPGVFVAALARALRAIGLEDSERLAVFKAFRPPLLCIAPDLYNHANGLLEDLRVAAGLPARAIPTAAGGTPGIILDRLLNGGRGLGQGGAPRFAVAM